MAVTVDKAFSEFMKNTVNLDPNVAKEARTSRDNLLSNIAEFDNKNGFFDLCDRYNIQFGSFGRKTKCRKLDDIDLMVGISANKATYNSSASWDNVPIMASTYNQAQIDCSDSSGFLNSTKVVNRFKKELAQVREYSRSEVKRNGEAIVLNLLSKDWSFDIVPCFHTTEEDDGQSDYLIPNGAGGWKKTNPKIDRDAIQSINKRLDGKALELIRLVKRWNQTKKMRTIPSYLLETIMLNYCNSLMEQPSYIDLSFCNALRFVADNITSPVYDPKNIQGDINCLSFLERSLIKEKTSTDYKRALDAFNSETKEKNQAKSIVKWGEIFGEDFPSYG